MPPDDKKQAAHIIRLSREKLTKNLHFGSDTQKCKFINEKQLFSESRICHDRFWQHKQVSFPAFRLTRLPIYFLPLTLAVFLLA